VSGPADETAIVETLNRFAEHVNRGEIPAALACFTHEPSIVEDIAPYHWQGPRAAGDWLTAMAENAQRHGMSGIHMAFGAPTMVMVEAGRGYAVLPGDLTYSFPEAADRVVRGHVTFAVEKSGEAWTIETLTWAWVSEETPT
jgi:hypothetical protein